MPYNPEAALIGSTCYFVKEATAGTPVVPAGSDAFRHAGVSMVTVNESLPIIEYGADNDPQQASVYDSQATVSVRTTIRPPKTVGATPAIGKLLENFFGQESTSQGGGKLYTLDGSNALRGTLYQATNIGQEVGVGTAFGTFGLTWQARNYVLADFAGFANSIETFSKFSATFASGALDEILPPTNVDMRTLISGPGPVVETNDVKQAITGVDADKATAAGDFTGANTVGNNAMDNGLETPSFADTLAPATGKQGFLLFGEQADSNTWIPDDTGYEDNVAADVEGRVACNSGSLQLNNGRFIDRQEWGEDVNYPLSFGPRESTFQITVAVTRQVERLLAGIKLNKAYSIALVLGLSAGINIRLQMPQVTLAGQKNPPPPPGSRGTPTATLTGRLTVPGGTYTGKEVALEVTS